MKTENQKGIKPLIIIFAIAAVLLIGGGVGYYFYTIQKGNTGNNNFNSAESVNQNINTSTDETAKWKTYKNAKYHYEFMYPERDWYFSLRQTELESQEDAVDFTKVIRQKNQFVDQDILYMRMAVLVSPNPNNYAPKEWYFIARYLIDIENDPSIKSSDADFLKKRVAEETQYQSEIEEIIFQGLPALKEEGVNNGTISFQKGENMFWIAWDNIDGRESTETAKQIFNNITSTFQFSENIYKDKKFGFQFQYPSHLILSEKEGEINLFDVKNPLLPPVFSIEVFKPTTAKGNNQSEKEFLKKVAEEKLGKESITKAIDYEIGIEVEAKTFFSRHFFIFGVQDVDIDDTDGYIIEIMEGRDGYFAGEEFKQILDSIIFPIF